MGQPFALDVVAGLDPINLVGPEDPEWIGPTDEQIELYERVQDRDQALDRIRDRIDELQEAQRPASQDRDE